MERKVEYLEKAIGNEYRQWGASDIIFITAPTGTGKTFFILNVYLKWIVEMALASSEYRMKSTYTFPNRILYLVNRKILKKQLEEELYNFDIGIKGKRVNVEDYITIKTYQSIEAELLNGAPDNLICRMREYDCVVCDEAHYFYADSNFNTNTEIVFDCIRYEFDSKIQIYMSATLDNVRDIIKQKNPVYTPYDRNKDRINQVLFRKKRLVSSDRFREYTAKANYKIKLHRPLNDLTDLIREIFSHRNEKWLIFVDSIDYGKDFQKELICEIGKQNQNIKKEDIVFIDAKYEQDEDASNIVKEIATRQYSSKRIIIATAVMDNGISFHDKELRNVAILADTEEEFIQMLGRKRKDSQDLNVYIFKRSKEYFARRLQYQKQIYTNYQKIRKYSEKIFDRNFDMSGIDEVVDSDLLIKNYLNSLSEEEKNQEMSFEEALSFIGNKVEHLSARSCNNNLNVRISVSPYVDLLHRHTGYIDIGEVKKNYTNCIPYENVLFNQQMVLQIMLSNEYRSNCLKNILYSVKGMLAINEFAISRCNDLIHFYQKMIKKLEEDDYAFVIEQASWIMQENVVDELKKQEEKKNKAAICDVIDTISDKRLSLIENEWFFKHKLRDEMLFFLSKFNIEKSKMTTIKKRNSYSEGTDLEQWKKEKATYAIPMHEKYINLVLKQIGSEYEIKKEKKEFVFQKRGSIEK